MASLSAQVGGPGVLLPVWCRPEESGLSLWEFTSLPSFSPELLFSQCPLCRHCTKALEHVISNSCKNPREKLVSPFIDSGRVNNLSMLYS